MRIDRGLTAGVRGFPAWAGAALGLALAGACVHPPRGSVPAQVRVAPPRVVVGEAVDPGFVDVVVVALAGSAWDPPGLEGAAWLGSQDPGAAPGVFTPRIEVGKDLVTWTTRCPVDGEAACRFHLLDAIALPHGPSAGERLRDDAWIARADRARRAALDALIDDPWSLADAVLEADLYGGHPYRWPAAGRLGLPDPLPDQVVDDLSDRRQLARVRTAVGVAGTEQVEAWVGGLAVLGDGPGPDLARMGPVPPEEARVLVVPSPSSGTRVVVGRALPGRLRPADRARWEVLLRTAAWRALLVPAAGGGVSRGTSTLPPDGWPRDDASWRRTDTLVARLPAVSAEGVAARVTTLLDALAPESEVVAGPLATGRAHALAAVGALRDDPRARLQAATRAVVLGVDDPVDAWHAAVDGATPEAVAATRDATPAGAWTVVVVTDAPDAVEAAVADAVGDGTRVVRVSPEAVVR